MNLERIFRKAAESALVEWHASQWDRQSDEKPDLANDLWVWYLETPETRRKMADLSEPEAVETARKRALQLLSRQVLSDNTFQGKDLYSSDSIKEYLKGRSNNQFLPRILPLAMDRIASQYREAIESRYTDGVVPKGAEADTLHHALKSLTEEVNVIYLTTDHDGIGSAAAVFPDTRKRKGDHSDPTGNIAVMLIERPEMRPAFYEETPLHQLLGGRGACPEYDLGDGRKFRPTGYVAEVLRRYPQLVEPYLEKVRVGTQR